jgi:hypothetical protein
MGCVGRGVFIRSGLIGCVVFFLAGCASNAVETKPSPLVEKLKSEYVDGWRVTCSVDKYTDERVCQANTFGKTCGECSGSVPVFVRYTNSGPDLTFGPHTHPGAVGKVRIDDNPVEYFDSVRIYGPTAKRIVAQMLGGRKAVATAVAWPSKHTEFTVELSGFPAAYERLLSEWGGGH